MGDVLDRLETLAVFFNSAANGAFLFALAFVGLILIAVFVAHMRQKVLQARARRVVRQAHTCVGHQSYDPSQDEAIDALLSDLDLDDMAGEWRRQEGDR